MICAPPPHVAPRSRTRARPWRFIIGAGLLALAFLGTAACSSADANPAGSAGELDASSGASSALENSERDTGPDAAEPREREPLNLPATAPGTDEAMEALFNELSVHLADPQAAVPWPDLRNPDPRAAYESAAAFQRWMSEVDPNPILVEGYTAPDSPERGFDLDLFDLQQRRGVIWGPSQPPYEMTIVDLVHPIDSGVSPFVLDRVPDGSVAIIYLDSWGETEMIHQQSGVVVDVIDGWVDAGPWAAIMAPTDAGWQVWYDELTDPPLLLPPSDGAEPALPADTPPVRT